MDSATISALAAFAGAIISGLPFVCCRFFGALPEFFRGWAEPVFCCGDAGRDRFRLRSDVQKFRAAPKTVTKVRGNGDAVPASTADITAEKLSCSSTNRIKEGSVFLLEA
jgi:hypothetical protein